MTRYVAQVERTPDGSLLAALYRDDAAVHVESVRSIRHGRRRAYDLVCSAADTMAEQRPSRSEGDLS